MERLIVCLILTLLCPALRAQGYDGDKIAFANFLVRMCQATPFDGVRAVSDYDRAYLISVVTLDEASYPSASALQRVAAVKAMAQATRFFSGATITQEMIIHTCEGGATAADTEIIEKITEHSVGYVKALELLTFFAARAGGQTFIFAAPLTQEE